MAAKKDAAAETPWLEIAPDTHALPLGHKAGTLVRHVDPDSGSVALVHLALRCVPNPAAGDDFGKPFFCP